MFILGQYPSVSCYICVQLYMYQCRGLRLSGFHTALQVIRIIII